MSSLKTVSKRGIAVLLVLAFLFSASITSFATNGFRYVHDPRDNAKAMADIVEDEAAIYGFRPSETGSLKMYADADWSDPAVVAQGRADRIAYHESIRSMYVMLQDMQAQGKSTEEIARAVSNRRNEIRLEAYANDPEGLAELKERNLEKYGHEEGPLPEELYEKYGSWERVMEKSFSTNSGMDACLGLYDDYYFLYVALGDVPADVTITLPQTVTCSYKRTVPVLPTIETNAVNYTVTYEVDDPKIASVDESGMVTGLRLGKTAVRCVVTDASGTRHVSAPCRVLVQSRLCQWFNQFIMFLKHLFK
ncbi:MAG: Ig-like domain-containing protein [Clostridia bacterium]|nr:Ig-like domain-containing protein [Clostridia bacterium]